MQLEGVVRVTGDKLVQVSAFEVDSRAPGQAGMDQFDFGILGAIDIIHGIDPGEFTTGGPPVTDQQLALSAATKEHANITGSRIKVSHEGLGFFGGRNTQLTSDFYHVGVGNFSIRGVFGIGIIGG